MRAKETVSGASVSKPCPLRKTSWRSGTVGSLPSPCRPGAPADLALPARARLADLCLCRQERNKTMTVRYALLTTLGRARALSPLSLVSAPPHHQNMFFQQPGGSLSHPPIISPNHATLYSESLCTHCDCDPGEFGPGPRPAAVLRGMLRVRLPSPPVPSTRGKCEH